MDLYVRKTAVEEKNIEVLQSNIRTVKKRIDELVRASSHTTHRTRLAPSLLRMGHEAALTPVSVSAVDSDATSAAPTPGRRTSP